MAALAAIAAVATSPVSPAEAAPAIRAVPAPPAIAAKRAEAQRVLREVQELDARLALAIERWNLASLRLEDIQSALADNSRRLTIARGNLVTAERTLAERLVRLYSADDNGGDLAVLLGATSLDAALDEIEATERVSAQDAAVIRQVRVFRTAVAERQAKLARDRKAQAGLVRERAQTRDLITGELGRRERLLASVRSEVERLEAAERVRQERLRREAEARLAAQREQERRAAIARAERAAAELAARREAQTLTAAEERRLQAEATVVTRATTDDDGGSTSGESGVPSALASPLTIADDRRALPPARYGAAVEIALRYLGVPYRWGGDSPATGFDCSGFAQYVFAQLGVSLPHHAATQYGYGTPVPFDRLEPGDLVFFHGLGHMGIYIGGRQFVHAPQTGDVVKISPIEGHYGGRFVGARRL